MRGGLPSLRPLRATRSVSLPPAVVTLFAFLMDDEVLPEDHGARGIIQQLRDQCGAGGAERAPGLPQRCEGAERVGGSHDGAAVWLVRAHRAGAPPGASAGSLALACACGQRVREAERGSLPKWRALGRFQSRAQGVH